MWPRLYYRAVILIAYALSTIFWLVGWSWSASWANYALSFSDGYEVGGGEVIWSLYGSLLGACAGLGALAWALSLIEFGFFCHFCTKYPNIGRTRSVELGKFRDRQTQPVGSRQRSYTTQSDHRGEVQRA